MSELASSNFCRRWKKVKSKPRKITNLFRTGSKPVLSRFKTALELFLTGSEEEGLQLITFCYCGKIEDEARHHIFFKFATTLVDLLFIQLLSHLSHVKQVYSKTLHLRHELKLCIQTYKP